jgi:predicted nuclease of predicted toxin-antitoxin system
MALKFLADHCISNLVIEHLRGSGHSVLRLRDLLPVDSPDREVRAKAQEFGAILLSPNGDFADIVTHPPANYRGIVALQIRNHPEVLPVVLVRPTAYLNRQPTMELYRGKLLVVDPRRIRIRE